VRNGDLERVLEEFPTDRPLPEQCALWIHALVGKHFFPDANHRTAIVTLRKLPVTTGWNQENGRRSGSNGYGLSHTTFEEIPPIHLDGLYEKDELYRVWLQFFGEVLPEEYR